MTDTPKRKKPAAITTEEVTEALGMGSETEAPKLVQSSEPKMTALAYVEEHPRLAREIRDILQRCYASDRRTRSEWQQKADELGGI